MPPRSPLPLRHGLDAAWVRTPDRGSAGVSLATMGAWLRERLGPRVEVDQLLTDHRFVYADARPVRDHDPCAPDTFVWFHRDLREEPVVPGTIHVVHRDERIVVVDKPPFLSTIPRGQHVVQSVIVRLREELGLPELSPAHRLDRVTSGLLVLTTERRWRAAYQRLFECSEVIKTYSALAPWRADLATPVLVRNHIRAIAGTGRAEVVQGRAVNAETLVEIERRVPRLADRGLTLVPDRGAELAQYRLTPRTGRTHQLRLHLLGLGVSIVGDPLYPTDRAVSVDDFSTPLQLLASELEFTDPVDRVARRFVSARRLPLVTEG